MASSRRRPVPRTRVIRTEGFPKSVASGEGSRHLSRRWRSGIFEGVIQVSLRMPAGSANISLIVSGRLLQYSTQRIQRKFWRPRYLRNHCVLRGAMLQVCLLTVARDQGLMEESAANRETNTPSDALLPVEPGRGQYTNR